MENSPSPDTTPPLNRLDYIDALRGVAALMVIIFHTVQRNEKVLPQWLQLINEQGARGVQLFYVISAFTIFLTLHARSAHGALSIKDFLLRRFFRIAPLFYCAVAFYLWLYGFGPRWSLGDAHSISAGNIIATLLFINGVSPYWINSVVPVGWSVTVEVMFYLCIPLLFTRIKNLGAALWFTVGSLLLSIFLNHFLRVNPLISNARLWKEFLFQWFFNQLPVFGLGIVLFFLLRDLGSGGQHEGRESKLAKPLLLASLFLIIALSFGNYYPIPRHFLYGVTFLALTFSLALKPVKIIVNSLFRYLGRISYSLYLTHVIALHLSTPVVSWIYSHAPLVLNASLIPLIRLLFVLPCATAISTATYYAIELPCQRYGAKIIRR